jgi:hypothetical protein
MKRFVNGMIVVTVLAAVLLVPATASRASWSSDNCKGGQWTAYHQRRKDAKAYATIALKEGYSWGGSCWNNNDKDDSPGEPRETYTGGEGPDCSGFVYKVWELQFNGGAGFTYHDQYQLSHGPYVAADFHSGDSIAFDNISKSYSTTMYMDAFASTGHVSLIWTDADPGDGTDVMAEARGEDYGTNLFTRTFRSDSAFTGVRRVGWTPDCYPTCQRRPAIVVIR